MTTRLPRSRAARCVAVTLAAIAAVGPAVAAPEDTLRTSSPGVHATPSSVGGHVTGATGSVSEQTGTFSYSYPIVVPPGRLGMAPSLALLYASDAPLYGTVAAGWSLSLPEIIRERGRIPSTTNPAPWAYRSTLPGGGPLYRFADPVNTGELAYRAVDDASFTRYRRVDDNTWQTQDPNGVVHRFVRIAGQTTSTERFVLESMRDRFGNEVRYRWEGTTGPIGMPMYDLAEITYTFNHAQGLEAHARVLLDYDPPATCGDAETPVGATLETRGPNGKYLRGARRLRAIRTEVMDRPLGAFRPVRSYALGYAPTSCTAQHGAIRLLTSIQETAASPEDVETTLPATTFEYGVLGQLPTMLRPELAMPDRGGLVTHGLSIGVPPSGLQETIRDWSFLNEMVMDIDGDGSQDLLSTPWQCSIVDGRQVCGLPSSCNMFIRRNPGGRGFAQAATPFPLPGVWADKYCTLLGQPLEAPVGLQPPGDTSVENGEETRYNHYRYLDFDGDGKVDQLSAIFEPAYGSRPDLLKPNCDPQVPNPGGVACDARAEVTPPVREDMLIYRDSQYYDGRYIWRLHRGRGDGGFESAPQFVWSPIPLDRVGRHPFNVGDTFEFIERKYDLVDIDGDGFLDAVWTEPGVVGMWAVWRGNGSGFTGQSGDPFLWPVPASMPARTSIHTVHAPTAFFGSVTTVTSTLMDTNGDGLIDLVVQDGANGVFSYLNTGVGFSRTRVAMMPAGAAIESTQTLPITLDNNAVRNSRMFLSRLADLDGDGLPERIVFTPASQGIQTGIGTVAIRHGIGTDLDTLRSTSFSTQGALGSAYGSRGWTIENFVIAGDLIDIDGDGYLDAVGSANTIDVRPADGWYEYYIPDRGREVRTRNPNATPPGILHTIRSGRDDTTVIAYATRNDPNVVRCPAAAPGAGCPAGGVTPRHVVSQVSVTSTGRSAAAVTSYRYDDAQVTRNIRGEAAFAGFAAVQVITPGDGSRRATTRRTYRYDQDHRGRLETETVLDGTTVLSHRENTYERQRLNQWPSGVLLDASTTTWACTRRTGTQAHQVAVCKENDNRLASTTTWQAVGPGGPPPGGPSMWLPHTTTTAGRSRVGGERKRTDVVTHQVVSDATSFLVLETDRTSDDTAAGVTTRLARTITEYEPGNLGLVRKVHRWIQGEDYATTVLKQRPTTGVLLWAQKAEQYAAAPDAPDESRLKTTLTYDERDLFVRETVNEVGHVTQTTIDLGTGAATGQYGPTVWRGPECSPRTCQRFYLGTRSEVDGFGRVVKQWRHSDTELPFDFPAPQISAVFTYTDAAGQPAVIESEIYRVLGDATTAVRQRATTDGTGLVLATLRHGSGNIPETGTTYTYTEAGMVKTVTGVDPSDDARTATTTHQYDALGRPTSAMRPDSTGMLVGYSGHETTTTETALGKDPGPLAVKVAYSDAFGNLVRSVEDGSATTTYTVDSAGRTGQIQDADGHVVTFTHDGLGRRRSITRGNRTWHYGFDRNGNLTSITAPHDGGDATAYTTTIAYDAVDRPTSRVQGTRALTASDLAQLGSGSATWIYDEGLNANTTGRLTTETTAVGTNSQLTRRYAYDIAGNPTTEQLTLQLLDGRFSIDRMLGRRFDMLNQPTSVTHGDGSGERPATYTEIGFDAVGRPSELRRRATPDAPESVVLASAEWSRSDRLRGRSAARAGVHLSQIIEHDALGRVTGTDVRRGPSATGPWTSVASQTQQYFAAGDPRSMTTFLAADKTSQRQDWTFEYDGKHQLVAATGAGFYAAEYGYSEAGRLEYAAVDGPGIQRSDDYEYHWAGNGPDAPVLLTGGPGGVRELVWDSAGNLQLDVQSAERAQYRYDGADDLRRADTQGIGGSSTELHYYDASGGRVATIRMAGGQPTGMTAWFGDTTLEYDGDGNLVRTEAAIGLAGSVGRIVDGGAVDYTFHNHLGHLLAATSEVGELIAGFTYSPYGELLRVAGSEADEFRERFSGKTLDRSGLSYYGARYYDPSLMLWTQADPLYRFAPDNAGLDPRLSLLYAFTRNNPLRYVDPDGLQAVPRVTGPGGIASVPAMRPPAHVPTPPEMERMLINGVGNATVMILSEETPEGVSQEANRQQRIATARVVRELAESDPMAREILGELIFGRNQHEIILVTRVDPQANIRSRPRAGNPNQGSDTVILINVDYEATVRNSDGSLLTLTWKTAALHELIHALEAELGLLYPQAPYRDVYRHIAEWRAVGLIPPIRPGLNENEYRARQGLPARLCYSCPRVEAPQMRPPR